MYSFAPMPLKGGTTEWLDLGPDEDFYLARVDWQSSGRLLVQVEAVNITGGPS